MAKIKSNFSYVCRGGDHLLEDRVPIHWTVQRGNEGDDTFAYSKQKAISLNRKEGKQRHADMTKYRNVFDTKTMMEFKLMKGMTPPKFAAGEEVYVVKPYLYDLFAAKGVIVSVEWGWTTHEWKYGVAWFERIPKGEQMTRGAKWYSTSRYFQENELYKRSEKLVARGVLIEAMARFYSWWAEFNSRLQNLKAGDLKEGEYMK